MKMMKLFGLAAAAVCLLALAGCGGQSGGEAGYTKEQVQTILDSCEELSLLIFSDSGAAQTAQGALEAYLQSQIENNRDYRPGEIPKLEDAVLRQEGSTVLLAVSADTPAVEALLG